MTSLYTPSSIFEEALCGGLGNSFISHQSQNKSADLFLESALVSTRTGKDSDFHISDAYNVGDRKKRADKTLFDLKQVMDENGREKEICFDYMDREMRSKLVKLVDTELELLKFYIGYLLNLTLY